MRCPLQNPHPRRDVQPGMLPCFAASPVNPLIRIKETLIAALSQALAWQIVETCMPVFAPELPVPDLPPVPLLLPEPRAPDAPPVPPDVSPTLVATVPEEPLVSAASPLLPPVPTAPKLPFPNSAKDAPVTIASDTETARESFHNFISWKDNQSMSHWCLTNI